MSSAASQTEAYRPETKGLDTWDNGRILDALLHGQERAIAAVQVALPQISAAAAAIAPRLAAGGKLIYAGAGSSIRIAVQDGAELPATFGFDESHLDYLVAGGRTAMFDTLADAEDDVEDGTRQADRCTSGDIVIAIAASGTTPFTIAAANRARENGALVVAVVNNANSPLAAASSMSIVLLSGPEVILGSTRMGAGTAQKAALNLLSTLVNIRLGAVHDGLMVNVRAENEKLLRRASAMVEQISGANENDAHVALKAAGGHVKTAVMLCAGAKSVAAANLCLAEAGNNLRMALATMTRT